MEHAFLNASGLESAMSRAIELAKLSPTHGENPQVGAVLINDAGEIVAEGFHRGAGTPHAEIDALSKVADARGLTAVVTLEPCNHHGKTGPCSEALIAAGIKRVVFGSFDPGKQEGGGRLRLEAAGVEVISDFKRAECDRIIAPWFVNKFKNRPYVVIKWASSVDGRTAAADGSSKWITGAAARDDVHSRRADSQSILVGTNTVEIDNPELTARKPDGSLFANQPLRVIVGERNLPNDARVFNDVAKTMQIKTHDVSKALSELFELGIRQVFVEGGATLQSALIRQKLADEFLIYLAPKLIGGPATAIGDLGVASIDQSIELDFFETKQLGEDILLRAINKEN